MSDYLKHVQTYIQDKNYIKAIEELSILIEKEYNLLELLVLRGDLYYNLQQYSKAINDYNKVLKMDTGNKIIVSKIEMIKDILKFQALDIFESTNLNKDPWLDD